MHPDPFQLSSYNFHLPPELIAQHPAKQREQSRLMVLPPRDEATEHKHFHQIREYLRPGDLLVVNNTKVFPARLFGKKPTGGKVELLLLAFPNITPVKKTSPWQEAEALGLIKSSKRPKEGSRLLFSNNLEAVVTRLRPDTKVEVRIFFRPEAGQSLESILNQQGQIPLPPYIARPKGTTAEDVKRYQTKYARYTGSVAAPTAGLHFSKELLLSLKQQQVRTAAVTLHVGYGTFAPVRTEDIREHQIHQEYVEVSAETAETINAVKKEGGRIWAVGTTTVRTLEFATDKDGRVQPLAGECGLFIYPGYRFRVVDNLITNFHLPQSSLLFLVAALAGKGRILAAYGEAVREQYRFFSYGDAMAIITKV